MLSSSSSSSRAVGDETVGLSENRTDLEAPAAPGLGERLRNDELEGTRGRLVAWEKVEEREGSFG